MRITRITEAQITECIEIISKRAEVRVSRGTDDKNLRCIQLNKIPACGYLKTREFFCVLEGIIAGLNIK